MFVQVIQGHVGDVEELRAALDRWTSELGPGARGWLGTTAGVTADGTAIALARFESEDAARRNSDRPEQHQWWMETAKLFAGDVTFHDCRDVRTFLRGGSDDAGFVQVIQSRTAQVDRVLQLLEESVEPLKQHRPDVIGGIVALHGDGGLTQAVYFASEAAAREGERKQPPPELQTMSDEEASLFDDVAYFDLTQPWFFAPR